MTLLTSAVIAERLRTEAQTYAQPERRMATVERLISACNAIARGELVKALSSGSDRGDPKLRRITAQNIAEYAKTQGWSGPTRTFLSNRSNGLIEYIRARENEREKTGPESKKKPKTQFESFLDKIEDIETRQYVRHEVERRKQLEQELTIIKNGLKRIPQIDLNTLISTTDAFRSSTTGASFDLSQGQATKDQQSILASLVDRLDDTDALRHFGLKDDAGDILSYSNALVISKSEMEVLRTMAGRKPKN
ncbi:MAG: hypothetical protein VX791_18310 [Pseudomonadota bacterium]|nr:hypothetical protein [Pseudomonadota bacterium]